MAHEPTTVTKTEDNGSWIVAGTTYIDGDIDKPWPVNMTFETEAEADYWIEKHGWVVE